VRFERNAPYDSLRVNRTAYITAKPHR